MVKLEHALCHVSIDSELQLSFPGKPLPTTPQVYKLSLKISTHCPKFLLKYLTQD